MSEIKWIKLTVNMFDDKKIRLIEKMPEGDQLLIIWIRLLALAGETNDRGRIYLTETVPYNEDMLATLFNRDVGIVRLTLQTLSAFGMIEILNDGLIKIENWEKHQNVDGMEKIRVRDKERKRKKRAEEKKKSLPEYVSQDLSADSPRTNPQTSHKSPSTDIDIELDIDKENNKKNKRQNKFDEVHLSLAELLFNLILETNPEAKKPNLNTWANDIRLCMEIDKRSFEQMKNAIIWSQKHEFWSGVILSPKSLRRNYDKMRSQRLIDDKPKPKLNYNNRGNGRKEVLPDWFDKPQEESKLSAEESAKLARQAEEAKQRLNSGLSEESARKAEEMRQKLKEARA
ncbi:hypothetical protein EP56_08450 [Listeriaceae bacterium FSL A5-0209]|nr:hypothetical protein EP56_08450 [Listeriaceae bacterium FSL A5-0209]